MCQGASKFKNFTDALQIHMVECSPALQKLQYQNLMCVTEDVADQNAKKRTISTLAATPVSWHAMFEQVPTGCKEVLLSITVAFRAARFSHSWSIMSGQKYICSITLLAYAL